MERVDVLDRPVKASHPKQSTRCRSISQHRHIFAQNMTLHLLLRSEKCGKEKAQILSSHAKMPLNSVSRALFLYVIPK